MRIYVGIDDSRQLDGYKAGETASRLVEAIEKNGWGQAKIPSRHRLYPHPSTGCRKHNTARSFSADIKEEALPAFLDYTTALIKGLVTPDSNTGLAIVIPEKMDNHHELVDYAYRVKEELVAQDEARRFDDQRGVYLIELNGTGRGIIGALAGAGLRSTGNDGQFRGKLQMGGEEYAVVSVGEIVAQTHVEQVKSMDFQILGSDEQVRLGEKVKIVLLDDLYTLMVFPTDIEDPRWQTSTTNMLRVF